MKGRKRHIVVDTLGLLLAVAVHPANIQDRDGAKLVLERMLGQYPWLKVIWADGAYGAKLVQWAKEVGQGGGPRKWVAGVWNWCAGPGSYVLSRYCPGAGWWNAPSAG